MSKSKAKRQTTRRATAQLVTDPSYYAAAFDVSNPGLGAYFGNVAKGQPLDYTVKTFAKGQSTEKLLRKWMATLKSIDDEWPTLWQFENDLANKVGPMSIMRPFSERWPDIEQYYSAPLRRREPIDGKAVAATISEFRGLRGLHLRSQTKTLNYMKLSTNSGSPFFTKRRLVAKMTVPCTVVPGDDAVYQELADGERRAAAAVLGWRGQEGGPSKEDVKQRVVWMFPFAVNVAELQVYQPLIEGAQKLNLVPAWVGMESVDKHITAMFDTKADGDLVVCTDFSAFDQHFNSTMQDAAAAVLSAILDNSDESLEWLAKVYGIKYMIPLAVQPDKLVFGRHGMASGSGGTNVDETLAHRSLQFEAAVNAGAKLNPYSQCLGDDGILTYPGITVEDVVYSYTKHGLEMNASKQYASKDDCTYLRRWHHKDYRVDGVCVGVYSTCRALGRLRYMERRPDPKVWSDSAFALRSLSILENCKWHPLRDQFFDYVMERDALKLGKNIPGFVEHLEEKAQQVMADIPDILGYVKSQMMSEANISDWWSVQRLRSKS